MHANSAKGDFIAHLHAFRGFAIINIVASHAWYEAINTVKPGKPPEPDRYVNVLSETLFHDSTIYFALISGLLFATVLKGRTWGKFFGRKLQNVVCPYVMITLVLSCFLLPREDANLHGAGPYHGSALEFAERAISNILHGTAMYHLWYMPVLFVLFACTPLVVAACASRVGRRLVALLALLPLVVSREGLEFNWTSAVYFLGVYSLGILAGANYESWPQAIARHLPWFIAAALLTSLAIVVLNLAGIDRLGPVSLLESLFYVQKLSIAGVALVLFKRSEASVPPWLDGLATYSFAIYFLHVPVIGLALLGVDSILATRPGPAASLLLGLGLLLVALLASMAVSYALRRLLGKRSRQIIGV